MKIAFILLVFPAAVSSAAEGAGSSMPFQPGEKMVFKVYWTIIPAGEAVLEVLPHEVVGGRQVRRFRLTAYTYPAVDVFYKVRDHMNSYVEMDMSRSIYYTRKTLGKKHREEKVVFDPDSATVRYSNFEKKRAPIDIEPGTFDPFAVFYAFRLGELREGATLSHPVADGKRSIIGRADLVRRENIETAMGKFEVFLLELTMDDISGAFEKPEGAGMQIWVTADAYRIPVRVRSKVPVGSFVAELVDIAGTDWPPAAVGAAEGGSRVSSRR
ncbi:MAG: DUF3108 domain-containing protein [Desulfatiglandaceae bacterium]